MQTGTALPHDTTPGSVTAADYDVWRANFGNTGGAESIVNAASVPEPANVVLALVAAILCVPMRPSIASKR